MINSMVPAIVNRYHELTGTEQIIGDYFINNRQREDFTIAAVAQRLFVSKASLSRFAQKLGFRGYREFIYQYERSFVSEVPQAQAFSVVRTYRDILTRCEQRGTTGEISRLCGYIADAQRILILGIGSSGLAAREMQSRFIRLGEHCEACDQPDLMRMQAILQNESCLVIGISLSGQTPDVLFALKQAYLHGAKTVLITGSGQSYDFLTEKIQVPTIQGLDSGNFISPQIPILLYTDLVYNCYINQHQNKLKLHEMTMEAIGRSEAGPKS